MTPETAAIRPPRNGPTLRHTIAEYAEGSMRGCWAARETPDASASIAVSERAGARFMADSTNGISKNVCVDGAQRDIRDLPVMSSKELRRCLAVILALCPTVKAGTQTPMPSGADFQAPTVTMPQAFTFNVLIGGTIAAFRAHIAGRSAWSAFKTGALGGGIHFLGKEIGVGRWAPSGVLGTVVAATGTSIVANASEGRGALSEVSVPVSAVRLRFTPGAQSKVHTSLY